MTPDTLIPFFGWLTLINFAILAFAGIAILLMQDVISRIHHRLLGLTPEDARRAYFGWLGTYKLMTLIFCFAPWLSLQIAF